MTVLAAGAATAAVAVGLFGGAERQELRLRLENASQIVEGNAVKVGGVAVGTVKEVALAPDQRAEIRIEVDEADLVPLHAGTRAVVRVSSLSTVANRFIALEPGPNDAPVLDDGAILPTDSTEAAIDLDAIISTLDADARGHLQRLSRGAALTFGGGGAEGLNRGLVALNPAVAQLESTLAELTRDRHAFERFLVSGASWISAVAEREADLGGALSASATTARAVAAESERLQDLLRRAPAVIGGATATLDRTRDTLVSIRPAVVEAEPVAPRLSRTLVDLDPALDRLPSALRALRPLIGDVRDWLDTARGLRASALPAFESTTDALRATRPMVRGLREYTPDLVLGATNGFGGTAAGPYDANGGYARIGALTGTFAASGAGSLLPELPTGFSSGNLKRCPGAGTQVAPDGSNRLDTAVRCEEDQRP